jgi:hypothetical protein
VQGFARDEIQRVFDGGADDAEALEEAGARALAGGEMAAYLDARAERVASLAGQAAAAAAAEGAGFTFMDASGAIKGYADGRPVGGPAPETPGASASTSRGRPCLRRDRGHRLCGDP